MVANKESPANFSRIYATYHDRVLAYVAKLIGRAEAEDVVQDVFVKISRSLDTLEDPARLASWIYAVTINTVRDAVRSRSIRPAQAGREGEEPLTRFPDGASRTPEEIAIRNEMVACYLEYVRQLPPARYEVYVLSEFEQLSNEDIARRLSLSVGAVKIRLHRARTELNDLLRRNCRCYYNDRGELMGEPKDR